MNTFVMIVERNDSFQNAFFLICLKLDIRIGNFTFK